MPFPPLRPIPSQPPQPTLITDKLDYSPTDTVNITGKNFTPFQTYTVVVSSTDNPAVSWTGIIFTDGSGAFNYSVKLDGNYRPNYTVEVKTDAGVVIATTTFTDTPTLTSTVLSWDTIGVDSNRPISAGPHTFVIQQRITNPGPIAATNVVSTLTLGSGSASSYISIVGPSSQTIGTINSGASVDVFYQVLITPPGPHDSPSNPVFGTTRDYALSTTYDSNLPVVTNRTLTIEGLNSQQRNSIQATIIAPSPLHIGDTFTVTVQSNTTGGGNFDDVSVPMTFDPAVAQLVSDSTTYTIPAHTETDFYSQNVGGNITSVFTFKATGIGSSNFYWLIYDHSGNSYHYNSDFGSAIVINIQPQFNITKTPATQTVYTNGDTNFTINVSNTGNGVGIISSIVDTLPAGFSYVSGSTTGITTSNPTISGQDLTWSGPWTINPGNSISITFHATASSSASTYTNSVIAHDDSNHVIGPATSEIIVNQATGTITVNKTLNPSSDSGKFNLQVDGSTAGTGANVGNNGTTGSVSVASSGTHTVGETAGTSTSLSNYTSSYSCVDTTNNNSAVASGSTTTSTSFTVPSGHNITCTFTNTRNVGNLTIHKQDQSGNPMQSVAFAISGTSTGNGSTDANGNVTFSNIPTGAYTVTETAPTDYHWTSTSGACTNANPASVTVTTNGENCTFVNTRDTGTIIVHKDVVNPDGGAVIDTSATFHTLLDTTNQKDIIDGGTVTYLNVPTGPHTVAEVTPLPAGYTLDSITNGGSVTVSFGLTSDVYIVNSQQKATLTVVKVVENPDGQVITTDSTHFTANVGGNSGDIYQGHDAVFSLNPATYSVTESTNTDYNQLGCKLPSGADAINFSLTPAQTLTVTCTNQQKPATITVYKNVLAADGITDVADSHSFNVTLNAQTKPFAEGSPAVYSVNPATYTALEDSLIGTNYTFVSNTGSVTVGSNGTASITIVNKQNPGSISGYKLDATTGLGISGWTINLSGTATGTTTTDATGFYEFLGLNVGSYTVTEAQPAGWTPVGSTSLNVTINPGTASTANNFTNFQNISITACKQIDADGSLRTTNDLSNKSGWAMTLSNGQTTDTQSTGENGCYTWTDKGPGSYSVSEETPSGWTNLTPTTHDFGTAQSGHNLSYTFINFDNGHISGHKFNDLNGNGTWDNGEPAISGWTISTVYPDQSVHTRTTDASGYYNFSNLGPGTYTVTEVGQTNWTETAPAGNQFVIDMTSNGDFQDKDFGNRGLGTITVHKVIVGTTTDLTQFCFTLSPDPNIGQKCANVDGNAVFNNVPAGTYTATENKVTNYTQTDTTCNTGMTITNGGDSASCTITNTRDQGRVSFLKAVDDNSDVSGWTFSVNGVTQTFHSGDSALFDTGTYTVTESGSADYQPFSATGICSNLDGSAATLTVTTEGGTCTFTNHVNRGTIILTKVTDPTSETSFNFNLSGKATDSASLMNGQSHTFSDLFPGSYVLAEADHAGWDLTTQCSSGDLSVDPANISLAPGETVNCTFTNTQHGSITIVKDAQPNSRQEFSFNSGLTEGSFNLVDDGDSQNSRLFSDLSAGQYTFTENKTDGWNLGGIVCDGTKTYTSDGRELIVNLQPGENATCTFTNTAIEPTLVLTKTNNAAGDKNPGDAVTFTLTLTVGGNSVTHPEVVDLPAKGFIYRSGSWHVTINGFDVTGSVPEPAYHSPGTWTLPDLNIGDIVQMTYIADIDSAQTPGLYNDLAWAQATTPSETTLIATGADSTYVNGAFVGTQVNVVKSTQDTPTINVENKVEGQVLGATTLPATGADVRWLYLALVLGLLGGVAVTGGLILKKIND